MQTLVRAISPWRRWSAAALLLGCNTAWLGGCGAADDDGLFSPPPEDSGAPSATKSDVALGPTGAGTAPSAAPVAAPSSATNASTASGGAPSSGAPSSGAASDPPARAAPAAPAASNPPPPAAASRPEAAAANRSVIRIERAEWDRDKAVLEVRGSTSSASVSLKASFGGRTEALENEDGEFRGEFSNVATNPGSVAVSASDGSTAEGAVEVK